MPTFNILREIEVLDTFRTKQVRGMFDLQMKTVRHEWSGEIPVDGKNWKIGAIVGPSGSGKTTLAKEAFPSYRFHEGSNWPDRGSLIDGFEPGLSVKQITAALNAVGFSSPPQWLKPFHALSNGQKFRVELARAILSADKGVIFDEFTSVVDRDVAKIGSAAVSKMIRRGETPPFVAVSCHYDILDWLDPDWVFDVAKMAFEWRERRRFPKIEIQIYRSGSKDWEIFRQHHYLSHDLAKGAQSFIATWEGRPVGFASAIHFPHPKARNMKKEHRVVVLPDFQGVGIGNRLSEWLGNYYKSKGYRYVSTSSNPAMIHHRAKSLAWNLTRFGRTARLGKTGKASFSRTVACNRITASFEYTG